MDDKIRLKDRIRSITNTVFFRLVILQAAIICSVFIPLMTLVPITKNNLIRNADDYNALMLETLEDRIDSFVKDIDLFIYNIYQEESQKYLNVLLRGKQGQSNYDYYEAKEEVMIRFSRHWGGFTYVGSIMMLTVIDDTGTIYLTDGLKLQKTGSDILHSDAYSQAVEIMGSIYVEKISSAEWFDTDSPVPYDEYYLFSRKLINQQSSASLGVLLLAIPAQLLDNEINRITNQSAINSVIVTGPRDRIVYGADPELNASLERIRDISPGVIHQMDMAENRFAVRRKQIAVTDWNIYILTPLDALYSGVNKAVLAITLVLMAFLVVLMTFAVFFSRSISAPIENMVQFTKKVENGAMDSRLPLNSLNEFNILAHSLNTMTEKLDETIRQNYMLGIKRREAELKTLQAQINPHFLFNTLNSIHSYATLNDVPEISNMTHALSDILRYSIKCHNNLVPVRDELSHITNYLFIQNIRFNNQIGIVTDIDPGILEYKIPPFLLQPLVENAIYHGLELKQGARRLTITGHAREDTIQFTIADNGIGMDSHKLSSIRSLLQSSAPMEEAPGVNGYSLGILNVHQRLRFRFGDRYGLDVTSQAGEGTEFRVIMPLITQEPGPPRQA